VKEGRHGNRTGSESAGVFEIERGEAGVRPKTPAAYVFRGLIAYAMAAGLVVWFAMGVL